MRATSAIQLQKPRSRRARLSLLVLAVLVATVAAACAGATSRSAANAPDASGPAGLEGAGGSTTVGTGYEVGPVQASAAPSAMPAVPGDKGTGGGTGSVGVAGDAAKVVKTGQLSLEVTALDDAVASAARAVVGLGGYVSGTEAANQGEKTFASITYRIPAARWDDAMAALRKLASKVVAEQTSAVEVTGQVLDLQARIRNLRATETALLGIMTKATKIADILAVQGQLTDVQGQIEELSTQQAHLEDQAALGTLTVQFSVPVAAVASTSEGWDPGAEIDRAVAALLGLGQGVASLGIWLAIVGLPTLVGLLVVLALAVVVARRLGLRVPDRRTPPAAPLPPADQAGTYSA